MDDDWGSRILGKADSMRIEHGGSGISHRVLGHLLGMVLFKKWEV